MNNTTLSPWLSRSGHLPALLLAVPTTYPKESLPLVPAAWQEERVSERGWYTES